MGLPAVDGDGVRVRIDPLERSAIDAVRVAWDAADNRRRIGDGLLWRCPATQARP